MNNQKTIIEPPNYTPLPNVVTDYWMAKLSPGAFKILVCMCRKIFGWHKTSDTISKNQLIKVSGMSKNSVQSAVEELESYGLLLKFQNRNEYGNQPNTYALNVQKPKDEIYQEQDPGSTQDLGGGRSNFDPGGGRSNIDLGVGQTLTQGVGQILTPQKKDSTKERLTKENTSLKVSDSSEVEPAKAVEKREEKSLNIFSEEIKLLANDMVLALKEVKPNYKAPATLFNLSKEIDSMIRLDGREPKAICMLFRWAVSDSFWSDKMFKPNPAKYLREKFDQLEARMNAKPPQKERAFARSSNQDAARETVRKSRESAI